MRQTSSSLHRLRLSLLLLTAIPLAIADPARCPESVSSPEQARHLADVLFDQGAYQHAGECYEAAGDHAQANKAFLKAVGPQSAVAARAASEQRDQAKALLRQVKRALR